MSNRLRCVLQPVRWSRFAKEHNAIRIRPFEIVVHAPAVGGLGEFLIVDEGENEFEFESAYDTRRLADSIVREVASKYFAEPPLPAASLRSRHVATDALQIIVIEFEFPCVLVCASLQFY